MSERELRRAHPWPASATADDVILALDDFCARLPGLDYRPAVTVDRLEDAAGVTRIFRLSGVELGQVAVSRTAARIEDKESTTGQTLTVYVSGVEQGQLIGRRATRGWPGWTWARSCRIMAEIMATGGDAHNAPQEARDRQELWAQLMADLDAHLEAWHWPARRPKGEEQGPTWVTQERAADFKKIKDAHPSWTQTRVAVEASHVRGENLDKEAVRYAYRMMGWKWERADRIR